jgi:hypothetical protein
MPTLAYRDYSIQYIEYQSVCPFVLIGPPHPLHRKRKWLHPSLEDRSGGGGTQLLPGEGVGGPNSDEGIESLVLYCMYKLYSIIPLR